MDRNALLHRAEEVKRQIFASLPWNIRFALVLSAIGAETGAFSEWGRVLGQYMLAAGVTGMPATGENYKPESRDPSRTLPHNYMQEFIGKTYGLLISKWQDPTLAKMAFNDFIMKLIEEKVKIRPESLESAESFIRQGIVWEAKSHVKQTLREHARSESMEDVGDESKTVRRDIADPHALPGEEDDERDESELWEKWVDYLKKHHGDLRPKDWTPMVNFLHKEHPEVFTGWMKFLERIHPDMPLYLKLRMDGYTNDDIVGAPKKNKNETMLPHYREQGHPLKSDPTFWGDKYLKKVIPASEEFFEHLHKRMESQPAHHHAPV